MLSDVERELVAASLDGEMPRAEAKAARRLLAASEQARTLRKQLRGLRKKLRKTEKSSAPKSLAPAIQSAIQDLHPFETIPGSSLPARRMRIPFVNLAIAASVVAVFVAGTFWLINDAKTKELSKAQVDALPYCPAKPEGRSEEPRLVVTQIPEDDPPAIVSQVPETETAPSPRPVKDRPPSLYGAPFLPPPVLESVLVKLPMIAEMKDLAQDSVRKQLALELAKSPRARIDLFSTDPLRALEVLEATGRSQRILVSVDPLSQESHRRKATKTWVVMIDALTAEEAAQWLAKLPAADASLFRTLHLPAVTAADEKEYKLLLGNEWSKNPKPKRATVSDSTIDEISDSLGQPKPALAVATAPPGVRLAPAHSAAVKRWLDERNSRKPGTVSLMIVIR